ncbi:EAL domain-containing protein [Pantoea agglomerans]|uniref:EAL domain-containing protein n=1 Tax=Enterobacter agglomerans TaxID=549 RepID=UPI0013BCC5E4|nr:EAL domain-containing protein [Pantoea agglomerans]NEG98840.1 EAL domain-containing protein [Pantoea agglomerans]
MFSHQRVKLAMTLVLGLLVTSAGFVFTWMQMQQAAQQTAVTSAGKAVNAIESLLDETQSAAAKAHPFVFQPCTAENRAELNRLVIGIEHIRMISIFYHGHLACSSFAAARADKEELPLVTSQKIAMLTDDYISPGVPVMILRSDFAEGVVTTSFPTHWVAEALRHYSVRLPLSLHAGGLVLNSYNALSRAGQDNKTALGAVHSGIYPFYVSYTRSNLLAPAAFLRDGAVRLLLWLLAGAIASAMLWAKLFRRKSAYATLAQAIENGEIVPWYQPQIDAKNGNISGVEVLARWQKPCGEMLAPGDFIPLAEQSGLIIPLTRKLMAQAAEELPAIISEVSGVWHVAVNITQQHILEPGFLTECLTFIDAFATGSMRMTVELMEREPLNNSSALKQKLQSLRNHHIVIALDDFGTGYANLDYLNEMKVDLIKIDRSFVSRLGQGTERARLLNAMIKMAQTLRLDIVAEGVETLEQAKWLAERGIDGMQGYLYSAPLPLQELARIKSAGIVI